MLHLLNQGPPPENRFSKTGFVLGISCEKCHGPGREHVVGRSIASNSYDCHMPNQPTNLILLELNGKKVAPKVRNHWIRVYPEAGVSDSKH